MTSPKSLSARSPWFRRRTFAAGAVAAGLALTGMGTLLQQASAQPVDSKIAATCALGSGTMNVSVPLTVDDKVDPVKAGGSEVLVTNTGLPELPVEATINKLVVTTPVPAQIASIDSVTFSGGNMKSAYSVSGSNLIVTFTGPVDSKTIQVPTVTASLTLRTDADGTINWKTFSEVDADTNYGLATCKPNDPNQVVNSTAVTADSPTTAPQPTSTTTPAKTPTTTTPPKSTPPKSTPPKSTTPKSTPPKSTGKGVSGSASIEGSVKGSNGGTGGSAPALPSSPGMPSLPSTPGLPTPPIPAPPVPVPSVPVPVPVPTASCPPVPTMPIALPAPTLPCPALPSAPPAPPAPAIPTPGVNLSVSGTVRATF